MKRLLIFLCALVYVACVREELNNEFLVPEKVYAAIEEVMSKAQLNAERKTVWTEKDTICVLTPEEVAFYVFDGKTGDRDGSFTKLNNQTEGVVPSDYGVKEAYAIYSYKSALMLAHDNQGNPALISRISNVQNYLPGSYGLHANVMFGTSSDGGKTFSFKNMFGYLRLSLTGTKKVRRIVLWENSYSAIAGRFYFFLNDIENIYSYDEFSDNITLDCGENGVQLSGKPTDFYFALPPCVLTTGLSIHVEFTDGTTYHQRTSNEIIITRNAIRPMATLATDGDEQWQYLKIYNSGPQISSPRIYGQSSMTGYIYWGEEGAWRYLDNYLYTFSYNDGLDSHVMTIKVKDAELILFNTLQGITKIDFSEF